MPSNGLQLRQDFFASNCQQLPDVTPAYYRENCPLGFDPEAKRAEFHQLEREISQSWVK